MMEQKLDNRQDFAMEFCLSANGCRMVGYSVFDTYAGGVYKGNRLGSDDALESALCSHADRSQLLAVKEQLPAVLERLFPDYRGIVGVDMLLYNDNGIICLHPMVEMNLRCTMGWVARRFSDRFMHEGSHGYLRTVRITSDEERTAYANQPSLIIQNDRIVSGSLCLTPIHADTEYTVLVKVSHSSHMHPNL